MIFFFLFIKYPDTHMRPRRGNMMGGMISQPETRLGGREDSKNHKPELHQLLIKSRVFNLYPAKDLSPATDLMGLENDIPDTPTAGQTTITLANAACRASTTTRVSADAVRILNLLNAKVPTDHVGDNLLVLAE